MNEYLEEWERYITNNYRPDEMNRCKLDELYRIADIMKDFAQYNKSSDVTAMGMM